jgi:hypothetical protein
VECNGTQGKINPTENKNNHQSVFSQALASQKRKREESYGGRTIRRNVLQSHHRQRNRKEERKQAEK